MIKVQHLVLSSYALECIDKDFTTKVYNLIFHKINCDKIIAPSLKSFFQEKSIFLNNPYALD